MGQQDPPLRQTLCEEGGPAPVPTSLEGVADLLAGLSEHQYGVGVATMAYSAQRAKMAQGADRRRWTELFVQSFNFVHRDISGAPEHALGR